jgi:hypothetical protein
MTRDEYAALNDTILMLEHEKMRECYNTAETLLIEMVTDDLIDVRDTTIKMEDENDG